MTVVLLSKIVKERLQSNLETKYRVVHIATVTQRMRYNDVAGCYVNKGEASYWLPYLRKRVYGRRIAVVWV